MFIHYCWHCGQAFEKNHSFFERRLDTIFCCRQCSCDHRSGAMKINCFICKKEFKITQSKFKRKNGLQCCSSKCSFLLLSKIRKMRTKTNVNYEDVKEALSKVSNLTTIKKEVQK